MKSRAISLHIRFAAVVAIAATGSSSMAANHVIEMRSSGAAGSMVFEPDFVRAAVGDTVVFKTMQGGGHSTASFLVPPGGKAWRGESDVPTTMRVDTEGIYLYVCEPHRQLGMVGVLQVGRALNLKAARAAAAREEAAIVLNKGRFAAALAQVR